VVTTLKNNAVNHCGHKLVLGHCQFHSLKDSESPENSALQ